MPGDLEPAQLALRRQGVTGSEIATIAGLAPAYWKRTVQDIWAEKVGFLEPAPIASADIERGRFLERGVSEWTAWRLGRAMEKGTTVQDVAEPVVIATPDYLLFDPEDLGRPLETQETKCPRTNNGDWPDPSEQPDGVPAYYLPQIFWEMRVAGVDAAVVSALLDGELRIYRVGWDEEFFQLLLERAKRFWVDYVEAKREPPITLDGAANLGDYVKRRWRQANDKMVDLEQDPQVVQALSQYEKASSAIKTLEAEKEAAKHFLEARIGENEGLWAGKLGATWKAPENGTTDWKGMVAVVSNPDRIAQLKPQFTKPAERRFNLKRKKEGK
jgi:putative phage-type endonuclease